MGKISAFLPVFNEEARLSYVLDCLKWCDEIIILDKSSTDRTLEIAKKYNARIFSIAERDFNPNESRFVYQAAGDWILFTTASDLIHPQLAREIRRIISVENFPFDVICVPYRRYVLGICEPFSPWYGNVHSAIIRKDKFVIGSGVHNAVDLRNLRHYIISPLGEAFMYHLTHQNLNTMMERHWRYWRSEARLWKKSKPLKKAFFPIFEAAKRLYERKTMFYGWKGIALASCYFSYFLMSFAFIWEKKYSNADEKYHSIRREVLQAWKNTDNVASSK